MNTKTTVQYTIRRVPPQVDSALRRKARQTHCSLNAVALDALRAAAGESKEAVRYRDLSDLAGTWVEDLEFDKIIAEHDIVHPGDWR